ncbi:anti-sigma factor [Oxynema sp. CENA135]|uniref:anti-sigma factor n=1 Tax=Oxynema sp. CENA135 TaxID=984206 RepID=UPI00190DD54E|nr:anti-sigma factor [Oxynema sp. CENA135]MBK4730384.1 anti-sigma factor [Oxynema sp. CENA135]
MSSSIPPEQLHDLIAGYVLNDLDEAESALLAPCLDDPEIIKLIEQSQQALETAYFPEPIDPSPHLRDRVMSSFDGSTVARTARQQRFSKGDRRVPTPPLPIWVKSLGIVAATFIVGLSISNYLLWRSLQLQKTQINQPSNALIFSLQPATSLNFSPKVTVSIDRQTLTGHLRVENLPPLAPGKVYVLWTVLQPGAPFTTDRHNAILTEVFTTDGLGRETQSLILPKPFQQNDLVKAIAITIEDESAPQQHNSTPILIQRL